MKQRIIAQVGAQQLGTFLICSGYVPIVKTWNNRWTAIDTMIDMDFSDEEAADFIIDTINYPDGSRHWSFS